MKKLILLTIVTMCTNIANAQWVQTNCSCGGNVAATISIASDGANIFAGTSSVGAYLSSNNGSTWTAVNNGLSSNSILSLAISGSNVYAGTGGGVYLSTNNGGLWTYVNNGWPSGSNASSIAISGYSIFASTSSGNGGVFLSSNNGGLWTATGLTGLWVQSLAISGSNIFAGSGGAGIKLSTDNGTNWTSVNNGLIGNTATTSLASIGSNIFAGTEAGVFLSTNNGALWTAVNTGLTNLNVRALVISGSYIFAGTEGGVFLSTNNGGLWTAVNNGLTNTYIRSLAISGTNIFLGTGGSGGGGVWKRSLAEMVGIEENSDNAHFILYPNPNSGNFKIEIDNKTTNKINLEIYNLLGKKIFSKTNLEQRISNEIDLSTSSKGIYFVQIIDENKNVLNRKIVVQ